MGKVQLEDSPPLSSHQLDQLETTWSCLFGLGQGQSVSAIIGGRPVPIYCPEASTVLLAMIWAIVNPEVVAPMNNDPSTNYPNVLLDYG